MKTLSTSVRLGSRIVGPGQPAFIIAEIGVNHFGNIELARHLIDMAVMARVDAVKFQIFKTENLVSSYEKEWFTRLKIKELPFEAFRDLKEYCSKKGILFFATAHDEESLFFLDTLDPPFYKIGSGEIQNLEYLKTIAGRKKPVILSTGMYSMEDVEQAVETFLSAGNSQLILLHCVTCYPTMPEEVNLKAMSTLREKFGCPVGYSDHTIGYDIVLAAVSLGADVIEKHITINTQALGSQDSLVSVEEKELIRMVNSIRRIEAAMGTGIKQPVDKEKASLTWARKSIVAAVDIAKGKIITRELLSFKRPGTGIPPEQIKQLLGKRAQRDIRKDSLITEQDIN
jgi:N-acetylneuraminate synthase/N,N'-diacetyllegionaminate synthase